MDVATLCAVMASLRVLPNRSQFFQYESVSLSCGQQGNSSEWIMRRNTSLHMNQDCPSTWNTSDKSQCDLSDLFPSDSGVYWCESAAGECSGDTVTITVAGGLVILESPALPVQEGEDVTLICRYNMASSSSSNLITNFYKDEVFIGTSDTGNLTLLKVSTSDEGIYKCNVSGGSGETGQSPDSWLRVRAGLPETPASVPALTLLPVVGVVLSLVSLTLLCLCRNQQGETVRTGSVAVYRPVR